jgi:hypothetical protein
MMVMNDDDDDDDDDVLQHCPDMIESQGMSPVAVTQSLLKKHWRIIFNGNGYRMLCENNTSKTAMPTTRRLYDYSFLRLVSNMFIHSSIHPSIYPPIQAFSHSLLRCIIFNAGGGREEDRMLYAEMCILRLVLCSYMLISRHI